MSIDELQRLQFDYPYFQTARFLYLKKLRHSFPERYPRALQENALYAGDRKSLFFLLEGASQSWSDLYPPASNDVRNDSFELIDSFLAAHASEISEKELYPGGGVVSEVPYRLEDTPAPSSDGTTGENSVGSFDLIDAFLEKSPEEKKIVAETTAPMVTEKIENQSDDLPEEEFLTESLAKIYIKQRRYSKALEIIRKLSLKYPEKNIYFADQIRFLEKLIVNIKTE